MVVDGADCWENGGVAFVVDDLADWLIGLLADAGRKRLATWVLGDEQERALRQAATAAVRITAAELRPEGGERAEELVRVISQVFAEPVPDPPLGRRATLLEALHAGVARQLAVLDDVRLTGTGRSSAEILGLTAAAMTEELALHLVQEIVARGSRGGPLEPLAAQLNHDMTHLQGERIEGMFGQLANEIREALARLDTGQLPPSAVLEVTYSLPPDTAAFTGRDEQLDQITAAAAGGSARGEVVAIGGIPGVGKTALAVHAAHLLRDRFPDRQLFINLHAHTPGQDPVSPEPALAALLTACGVDPRYLPGDLEGRVSLWRDRMTGQRTLLVLDNAASSGQVTPLLPGGEDCLVLVTSRRHLGDLPGAVIPVLLDSLLPDKAQDMFLQLAPRAATGPEEVQKLIQLAGYLPLAISLLARVYARHPSWTLADLTAETEKSMLTLAAERNSIAAAFDVSYRYLAPGQQEFFRRLGLHPGTTIDAYAAAALAGISLQDAAGQLDALHGEGLLTEAGYRRYGMHDLIRRYAQDRAAADPAAVREQALERLLDYYQHTAALAEVQLARQARTGPAAAVTSAAVPVLPDNVRALAWARAERGSLLACLDQATVRGRHSRVVALTAAMAAFLRLDGPWADAIARHTAAVQAARRLGDRDSQASALTNLGIAQRLTGDHPGTAQALEEALNLYRDLNDKLGQANVLSELGMMGLLTGDYLGAVGALEEAQGLYRDLDDKLGQANSLSNLGTVRRATGNYPDAAQDLEKSLSLYRHLDDKLGQATALTYLGAVQLLTGDYLGAVHALEESLSLYRHLDDKLGQANALNNLGIVRLRRADYPGAAQALDESLTLSRHLGNRHGQANALNNLGTVRRQTGDHPGAARALAESMSLYRDLGDRGGENEVLNEAGSLHRVRGDLPAARPVTGKPWTWLARSAVPGTKPMRGPGSAGAP
jgi:tetratricopeptide (TPR) repeat protein